MPQENLMDLAPEGEAKPAVAADAKPATETPPADAKPAADAGNTPPTRPDGVPEKFWDAEKGVVNTDAAIKSYTELEKEIGKLKTAPKEYTINVPTELKDQVNIAEDDPMLTEYKAFAKENGFTQDKFDANLKFWLQYNLKNMAVNRDAEVEKLGGMDKAVARVQAVRTWGKAALSEDSYNFMSEMATSAEAINFFDEVRKMSSVQENPPNADGSGDSGDLTKEKLNAMMQDERYWKQKDPAYIAEVTKKFQQFYTPQQG